MMSSLRSFNFLVLIPSLLFICLLGSIFLVVLYPLYSVNRLYIEVNDLNTEAIIESGGEQYTQIQKSSTENYSGFECKILDVTSDPTCRLEIWVSDNKEKGFDLSDYDQMTVFGNFVSPSAQDFLRISLRNFEENVSAGIKEMDKHYKYNLVELVKSELGPPIVVDFNRLIVPNWWLSTVRDQDLKSSVELSNVPMIEISTGSHASAGNYSLRVSALELKRQVITIEKLYEYLLLFWAGILFFAFLIISLFLGYKVWSKNRNESTLMEINESLAQRTQSLELINKTDELTSVLNRNGMKQEMMECLSNDRFPLTAVMIDIDYFKKINDECGHQKGDTVLINLGRILNRFTQNDESVSRFGGEEFIILMPDQNRFHVEYRLEKLRKEVERYDMQIGRSITVSMGVATANGKYDFNILVENADKALYEAKKDGRNCIKYYE